MKTFNELWNDEIQFYPEIPYMDKKAMTSYKLFAKKIYDTVIGIDILTINSTKCGWYLLPQYKNLFYYSTKALCLGLYEYKKLLYYDASTLIVKNIDYLFEKYHKSTYRIDYSYKDYQRGLIANFFMFIPQKYYIEKIIYLVQNYDNIFKDLGNPLLMIKEIKEKNIIPKQKKKSSSNL
jgi:hypothetical protein